MPAGCVGHLAASFMTQISRVKFFFHNMDAFDRLSMGLDSLTVCTNPKDPLQKYFFCIDKDEALTCV